MGLEWIAKLDFVSIANALVVLITGLAVGLGFRSGKIGPKTDTKPETETVALAGALVDGSSVRRLSESIDRYVAVMPEVASDNRKVKYEIREALDRLSVEVRELRHEMSMKRR